MLEEARSEKLESLIEEVGRLINGLLRSMNRS